MSEKRLIGNAPRCGKIINQYTCPECKVPLRRLDTTLFQCPMCLKKVKAIAKELPSDYGYYTDNQARKKIEELFKHKTLNCSDRIKSDRYD